MIGKKFDELRLTGALPTPSTIGLRILEITQGADYDQDELVRTIMADPALSGRILKLANSALNEGAESVASVDQATMRIGSHAVRTVALGFTLISDNRTGRAVAFDYDDHWSRALANAVAANSLALELEGVATADAFTCSLLADVGCLALASVHPERYSALLSGCTGASGAQLAELETQAFDIDHYEVGAALMADWGLPDAFQHAVLGHEREQTSMDSEQAAALAKLLRASKAITAVLVCDANDPQDPSWIRAVLHLGHAAEELGVDHVRFLTACDDIAVAWRDWGALLGVPVRELPPHADQFDLARESADTYGIGPVSTGDLVIDRGSLELAIASPSIESAGELPGDVDDGPTSILLIDDDKRMLKLIGHHLRREGFEVDTAESSDVGLQKALEGRPQLVITDWMMPGMSGLELCRTLRQTEAGRRIYLLVVTAREDDERVVEAFAAGADDYIVKPFNPRILLARVHAGQRMVQMRERVEAAERVRLRQVAELGILNRRLRAAAMTDPLTELPNRRYAMKRLKQEWDAALRTGRPLSVVVADIDHFKLVNDRFGHDAGDAVLRELATLLRRIGRSGDVLCRMGGEEFMSIDMACTAEEAALGAERVRKAVENLTIRHLGFDGSVTLSLGVAERTPDMVHSDDLIRAADQALYVAKSKGRNCVVIAEPEAEDERKRA